MSTESLLDTTKKVHSAVLFLPLHTFFICTNVTVRLTSKTVSKSPSFPSRHPLPSQHELRFRPKSVCATPEPNEKTTFSYLSFHIYTNKHASYFVPSPFLPVSRLHSNLYTSLYNYFPSSSSQIVSIRQEPSQSVSCPLPLSPDLWRSDLSLTASTGIMLH